MRGCLNAIDRSRTIWARATGKKEGAVQYLRKGASTVLAQSNLKKRKDEELLESIILSCDQGRSVTPRGGSSCFKTCLILKSYSTKPVHMSGFFSFFHFHWIRDVDKPLKPILFENSHPPSSLIRLQNTLKQKNALVDVVG
jgi:hypothetical protein